jgi:hypothetical protein
VSTPVDCLDVILGSMPKSFIKAGVSAYTFNMPPVFQI